VAAHRESLRTGGGGALAILGELLDLPFPDEVFSLVAVHADESGARKPAIHEHVLLTDQKTRRRPLMRRR
jgi:hypothetical protein